MEDFLKRIKAKAKECPGRVVFPEGSEERILKATEQIINEETAHIILVGDENKIKEKAEKLSLNINFSKVKIVNNKDKELVGKYAQVFFKMRKNKGLTLEKATETIQKINYFATMMVHEGDAEGMISGTTYSTAETIRPALQIIKTKEKFHKVSGMFLMIKEKKVLLFADTAITIDPNSHDLADIAIDTAETAKRFNIEPKIAMLSFSTNGSAKHPSVDKVKEATAIIKNRRPDLIVEGEMQVDSALVPKVCLKKFPNSKIMGDANILIFPDLNSGNIAYKLVERLGNAKAVGPILQGLKKPINDLSRGCSVEDIVNLAAITSLEICESDLI